LLTSRLDWLSAHARQALIPQVTLQHCDVKVGSRHRRHGMGEYVDIGGVNT